MSTKDKLLHWAAQLDQIYRELEAEASLPEVSLSQGHEMMGVCNLIRISSSGLVRLTSRFK